MFPQFTGLKRTSYGLLVFAAIGVLVSCSSSSKKGGSNSGIPFRAFVSNPVHPSALGGGSPVLEIMDANQDLLSGALVPLASLAANLSDPGMMAVSPNHGFTVIMSPTDRRIGVVDNIRESLAGTVTLPGSSDSFFVWTDNKSVFAAVPNAPIVGQAPGAVERIDVTAGAITATIPIAGAHYVVPSPNGNQMLVFSDNVDTVVLITPSLIGVAGQSTSITPCTSTQVPACTLPAPPTTFDRPISAVFDPSGTTAYVLSCGAECGGTTANVTAIDMTNTGNPGGAVLASQPVAAATTGFLQGTQLYVSGTVSNTSGVLTVMNLASGLANVSNCASSSPANCQTFSITDGYHTLMQLGPNGRLFIGSKACAGIGGDGVCLSIFDTGNAKVIATPTNSPVGNVTGIAPIPNRNVVYVCQGGVLRVYDTTTDQLKTYPTPQGQPDVIGQAVDVKVVDF